MKAFCRGFSERTLRGIGRQEPGRCRLESDVDRIVGRFGLQESKFAEMPMESGFKLEPKDLEEEPTQEMITLYRSIIGSIGYCCIALRCDCMYVFSILNRYLGEAVLKTD